MTELTTALGWCGLLVSEGWEAMVLSDVVSADMAEF
jgi:hypothetical protein